MQAVDRAANSLIMQSKITVSIEFALMMVHKGFLIESKGLKMFLI